VLCCARTRTNYLGALEYDRRSVVDRAASECREAALFRRDIAALEATRACGWQRRARLVRALQLCEAPLWQAFVRSACCQGSESSMGLTASEGVVTARVSRHVSPPCRSTTLNSRTGFPVTAGARRSSAPALKPRWMETRRSRLWIVPERSRTRFRRSAMRKVALVMASAVIVSLGMASAVESAEMFPANLNDNWVLQRFNQPSSQLRVTAVNKGGWAHFEGLFEMDLWLKSTTTRVYAKPMQKLYDFAAPKGTEWDIRLGKLSGIVTVAEKGADLETALGPQKGCTAFSFAWEGLADTGVALQWFCPGTGLVKQDKLTIAGVETESTVAASIRGALQIGYLGQGMNVRVDQGAPEAGSVLKIRLELWDTTGTRRTFHSRTTQLFDIKLVNDWGIPVRFWSAGQIFSPTDTEWVLEEDMDFEAELPLSYLNGHPLIPGLYTVEGWVIDEDARPSAKTQILVK
jgi:hypothetical protein